VHLGEVRGDRFRLDVVDLPLDELREAYETGLARALEGVAANS
jgi:hypothetical protein